MVNFLSIIALGFVLGMRHATDPDHVIAVSTIVSREHDIARSALIGTFWGVGHTLTILLVGGAIILFNLVIPPRIGLSMELLVALMLITLGLINVHSVFRSTPIPVRTRGTSASIHSHVHNHGDYVHSHPHGHFPEDHPRRSDQTLLGYLDRTVGLLAPYQYLRPLIVGTVHGLAGSAAVALLVLATIHNSFWAVAYLAVFGVGTIGGMTLITVSLASSMRVMRRSEKAARGLAMASGLLSLCFGIMVVYQICFVNGLFNV
jgi:ABC-type nickel/cobalt efflux system permease component RcnA